MALDWYVHVRTSDSPGWLVEFIAKFLQFQPEAQQNFIQLPTFDYSVVVLFRAWQYRRETQG